MRILLDTNILTRLVQPNHPHCSLASASLHQLLDRRYQLCLVPQILYEYWAVCTRPVTSNGLDMTVAEAETELVRLQRLFRLLRNELGVFQRWEKLVVQAEAKGKTSHDAHLVAAMDRHRVKELLTFNAAHFARFPQIVVRTPDAVVAWTADSR